MRGRHTLPRDRSVRLQVLLLGLVTLALAVLPGAGTSAASPTASVAAAPRDGAFTGRTAQGRSISLTVRGGAIRRLRYGFKVGGCGQTAQTTGRIRVRGGRFRSSSSTFDPISLRSYTTTVAGTFNTPSSVRGTIRASTPCGSRRVTYRATRR